MSFQNRLAARARRCRRLSAIGLLAAACLSNSPARAAVINSNWNVGNGNWNIAGNWSPSGVPINGVNTYNVSIGNLAIASGAQVTYIPAVGTSSTISTLTVSNNADLVTNGLQLNVLATTTIDGVGSTIRVDPHASPGTPALQAATLLLNNGGGLTMSGGIASISGGQLEINAGSVLAGHGQVDAGNFDAIVTQAFENSGLLQLQGNTAAPQTLTIHANGVDTIDLDGDSEAGVVDADNALANINADSVTLIIDGALADPFGGLAGASLQIGQRDTVTFTRDFSIAGPAAISMTGGTSVATLNGAGKITSITGATFSITNAAVITNDMTFSGTANTITVNGNSSLELAGTVTVPHAAAFVFPTSTSELVISGTTAINDVAGDFNFDGTGISTTTVKGNGALNLTVNHVDQGDDLYGGTLNLVDNGDLFVNNVANVWTMAGTIHKSSAGSSSVTGDSLNLTGAITVDAGGSLALPTTTLASSSNTTVNGTLTLGGASVLAGPSALTGTGLLRLLGTSTVTANTTINTTSFDWDGSGAGTTHTINDGIVFTLNSTTWDADDAGDMDDPINIGGTGGTLAVNNVPSWTMTRTLTTNTSVTGITSLNGNSRMILSGASAIWNANGQTAVNAPVTFGTGSTANIAAAGFIRLNGGDAVSVFNRIEGGIINGPGPLVAINTHELRGFGTINAPITFQNASSLRADDGTLTISGAINQVSTIGTADNDGTLNVVNAWNSNVAASVVLNGGTLQGGTITVANANGIKGRGSVSARVVNNTRLEANIAASTLVFETAANDNDWDGGANTGILAASNGGTLEVRDNATFTYGGTITATGGSRVYAKGFGFNFATTSVVNLTNSTLQTDESTNFDGAINVAVGGDSTITVQVNRFLTLGSTSVNTLGSNLRLVTNNGSIEAGASFSGSGAVIVPASSHLILEPNANVNTLLAVDGTLRPSGFNTVGVESTKDLQVGPTGLLEFELTGTLLNQYDRLTVSGTTVLDGYVVLDIDGAFVPTLGQTFNLISSTAGVIGTFDSADISGMPAGLTFAMKYTPTLVQAQVVTKPLFTADFDDDGDVDDTDLAIWRHAYNLNQLGDADGDNDSDIADYTIWRQQYGSKPQSFAVFEGNSVPEPGTALGLLSAALLALRRRARRMPMACAVAAAALPASTALADATISINFNGLVGPNSEWVVQVTPQAGNIPGSGAALATELGIELTAGTIVSATKNAALWPYNLPGTPPAGYPTLPQFNDSVPLAISGDNKKLFTSLGSNPVASATPVELMRIVTAGTGLTSLRWGKYVINARNGALIAQNGVLYSSVNGESTHGLAGDFDSDGTLDADDMDLMYATPTGSTLGFTPPAFAIYDLNGNTVVNKTPQAVNSDADVWVHALKHTEYGDIDLDGKVNFSDLLVLASNYNAPTGGWAQGDMDGVEGVAFGDLLLLAAHYGFTSTGTFAADWALAQSMVPEPTLAAGLGTAGLLLRRRRS
ncbi:MAG: PEP-CTERM sorting domain-containing protein [Tepidisphaeraceae bacterium]